SDRFRDLGFEVHEVFDADNFALHRAVDRFIAAATNADLAVFYFAGHGIQLFDRNVLLSTDANTKQANRIDALGLDLIEFMTKLRSAKPVRIALLVDACRDNPLSFDDTTSLLRRLAPSITTDTSALSRSASQRGLARTNLPIESSGTGETLLFF